MKAGLHPEAKEATVKCACGATFKTKSNTENIHLEVCSECHSFYTGSQGKAKKTGSVEKFNKKYGFNQDNNNKTA